MTEAELTKFLENKSLWARKQTLLIHKIAPSTRIASSLSAVEIFSVLYYGKILKYNPKNVFWEKRDRLIVSKAHGAISLYPILSDLGFFSKEELHKVCQTGSLLGSIPDPTIPGFETINGSLGHGLGVGCGMSLAIKSNKEKQKVFVLMGDGELFEGAVWEAIMFAGEHQLGNLILIIDNNKTCMLDRSKNVIDLYPLKKKFEDFNWLVEETDGHNIKELYKSLKDLKTNKINKPKVLIADTVKGKGVASLENNSLSHIKTLKPEEIDIILSRLK